MGKTTSLVTVCLAVALAGMFGTPAYGADEPGILSVRPGTLTGTLTGPKGTPISDTRVVLMQDGKDAGSVMADANGRYAFEGLKPGAYEVVVPGAPPFKIAVSADATASSLTLMLSEAPIVPATPSAAAAAELMNTQWVWVGIGTGAVAVAVPVVAASGSGGSSGGGGISD